MRTVVQMIERCRVRKRRNMERHAHAAAAQCRHTTPIFDADVATITLFTACHDDEDVR